MSISIFFIPNFVCVLTNKIQNISDGISFCHLGHAPGVGLEGAGGGGGAKTLAWGFAMGPHRLHILILNFQ